MGYDRLLEDYAYEGWALLELFRATGEERYLRRAGALAQEMEGALATRRGGYYLYRAESEALVVRPKETYDGAVPSGNAMAALVLLRLSRYTGEDRWRQAAGTAAAIPAGGARGDSLPVYLYLLCAGGGGGTGRIEPFIF